MAWQVQEIPWGNDGLALATSQTVTADGVVGAAVEVGRGDFDIEIDVTSLQTGVGFDAAIIWIQANTLAATTTWTEIGVFILGDATAIGSAITSASGDIIGVKNCADYQVRAYAYIQGSTTRMNGVSITAYPRRRKEA